MARVILVAMVLALAGGIVWRFSKQAEARTRAEAPQGPQPVRVVHPVPVAPRMQVTLPGTVRPKNQVTLYARSNGFVHLGGLDLGDAVKKDQVIARLDAPELAASLSQAKTRQAQAQAAEALVRAQHERTVALSKNGNLSAQDVDGSSLRLTAAQSELATSKAELDRLAALFGYLTVKAPFDGTLTRRLVDEGALVSAERTALFELMSTEELLVDVDVPQWAASGVTLQSQAKVSVSGQSVDATVVRTAGALDPVLRTQRTQLVPAKRVPALVPGAYVKVVFEVPRTQSALQIPGAALSVRGQGSAVLVVRSDDTVQLVPVQLVREMGRDVEVLGELSPESRIAMFPPATLKDGDRVKPIAPEPGGGAKQ